MSELLRESASIEVVYPDIHGVDGTSAMASGQLLISGLGGLIEDDPKTARDEREALRYPGWELEYRLKFLRELKDYQKFFCSRHLLHARVSAHDINRHVSILNWHAILCEDCASDSS